MSMITEDYVSFEVARLLKDKGFNEHTLHYYVEGHLLKHYSPLTNSDTAGISAPTFQMAMKWLREVHKIHIVAEPCLGEGFDDTLYFNRWFWTILKEEGEYKPIRKIDEFPTYEQACEAAIKYCLENLI